MKKHLCWIRRDLRLHDHHALSKALTAPCDIVFCFDPLILDKLTNKHDRRLTFIIDSLKELELELQSKGASLHILFGDPQVEIPKLAQQLKVTAVFTNRDYEPYAKKRDAVVGEKLLELEINFHTFKDSVFYEQKEILNGSGSIYKVFTPYKNKWLETLREQENVVPDFKVNLKNINPWKNPKNIIDHDWHSELGFIATSSLIEAGSKSALKRLKDFNKKMKDYGEARDIPSLEGTSNLSPSIRHGCLSVRDMVRAGLKNTTEGGAKWLSEVIWRDFYHMLLDAFPHVEKKCFKPDYDQIKWLGTSELFKKWCEGQTGYPLVDAAMRCLNETGMMHNRLRMVVASFLCKTLLIDWRKGEKYFAEKLLDFDLAANNGGWQWSSSTGCDAQPYFRIFNPYNQSEKFDKDGTFIRQWVRELKHIDKGDIHSPTPLIAPDYPRPVVVYEKSRQEALKMYAVVKKE